MERDKKGRQGYPTEFLRRRVVVPAVPLLPSPETGAQELPYTLMKA